MPIMQKKGSKGSGALFTPPEQLPGSLSWAVVAQCNEHDAAVRLDSALSFMRTGTENEAAQIEWVKAFSTVRARHPNIATAVTLGPRGHQYSLLQHAQKLESAAEKDPARRAETCKRHICIQAMAGPSN